MIVHPTIVDVLVEARQQELRAWSRATDLQRFTRRARRARRASESRRH